MRESSWAVVLAVAAVMFLSGAWAQETPASAGKLSALWEELTAADFVTAIHESQGVCLLPFGILEKHGPHMPLGTDLINARWVAQHAAAQEYAVIFPAYISGRSTRPGISPAPSPTAGICNWICYRKPLMKWRAMAAGRSSS